MSISSYCSMTYLVIFLPCVLLLYTVLPRKIRPVLLLLSSYILFFLISGKLLIYLLLSTLSIHAIELWLKLLKKERKEMMDKEPKENKKVIREIYRKKQCKIVAWGVILQIGMLVVLKYTPFLSNNINTLFAYFKIPISFTIPTFTVPIGLSFFTLQAVSYIFDVYREKITADTHLGRLALYMVFFPQIMEGPICRYQDTAPWLWQGNPIKIHLLHFGCQRILFGLFKKIVIADRLNLFIQTVFNDYVNYNGGIMMLAMILYTCQLYCEFSGTMDVVIGSSQIFGITLPENFRQPFFSMSISEFWQRWHITLGTWFKDYIFLSIIDVQAIKKNNF